MIHSIKGIAPRIAGSAFVAWNAEVAGDVSVGEDSSVWFSATARGDIAPIRVGRRTSIQDGAILHVNIDLPCEIGDDCTVGHGAILHGCRVGNGCLIGMGAVVLNGAAIGDECIVGAGALVTEGKSFPPRTLVFGNPAKAVRQLGDEDLARVRDNVALYVELTRAARRDYAEIVRT
jgi:carbonic anhydrase/acetyltransferase-like protein (isoleucine patch superfamily)